jgi:ribulose-bisphosphate carboxylase large chain
VQVSTTDEFTKGVDALVYLIAEVTKEMRFAHPSERVNRPIAFFI